MSLLSAFRPKPAPVRQPGRHSAAWSAMVDGVAELQRELETAKARCRAVELRLKEANARARGHTAEIVTWSDALDFASEQFVELERLYDERGQEIESLRVILAASNGDPGMPGWTAPLDDPQSCFSQPSPPPAGDEPRIVADTPVAPASYEIADVNAETQAVDVAALRDAEATQQLDAAALRNATGLGATAVLPVVAAPPLPDCKPPMPGEVTLVDAVLPLWQQSVPVSLGTGQRARDSVQDALASH
jgi:hypothetical protein